MSAATIDHEVVIACAGFSGIGIGIALNKASIDDYLIVEEGEVDRTWYWNTYPGVAAWHAKARFVTRLIESSFDGELHLWRVEASIRNGPSVYEL